MSVPQSSLYPTSQHRRRTTVSKRRHTYQYPSQVYIPPHNIGGEPQCQYPSQVYIPPRNIGGEPQCQKDGTHISTPAKSISHLTKSAAGSHISIPLPSLYPTSQHQQRTTVSKRRHTYQHPRSITSYGYLHSGRTIWDISVTSKPPALSPRTGTCTVPQTSLYPTS